MDFAFGFDEYWRACLRERANDPQKDILHAAVSVVALSALGQSSHRISPANPHCDRNCASCACTKAFVVAIMRECTRGRVRSSAQRSKLDPTDAVRGAR
jgi:hypothetical protein